MVSRIIRALIAIVVTAPVAWLASEVYAGVYAGLMDADLSDYRTGHFFGFACGVTFSIAYYWPEIKSGAVEW